MIELFTLLGKIAVENTEADKAIDDTTDKAKTLSEKMATGFQNVGNTIANVGTKITKGMVAVGTAVGAGATAVYKFAEKSAGAADNVDKMSQKIGISREAYQELDFICSQSGTSVDTLQMGIKTLTNQMQSASDGTKSAVEMFDKLGVSIYDSNGQLKDQETMMWEAMNALQSMENQTEKAALANDLFGRSGSELMPLLNGAAGSIDVMKQQAHDLGLIMSDETVDAGVKLTDTIDQAKRSFSAIAVSLGAEFMPMIQQAAQYIVDHVPQIREKISGVIDVIKKISSHIGEVVEWFSNLDEGTQKTIEKIGLLVVASGPLLTILGKATSGIGSLISVGSSLAGGIGKVTSLFGSFGGGLSGVAGAAGTASGGLGGLSGALGAIASPVGIVIAAITALVGVFLYLWNTNEEFRTSMTNTWNEIVATCSPLLEELKTALNDLWQNVLKPFVDFVGQMIAPVFEVVFKGIGEQLSAFLTVLTGVIEFITGIFTGDWEKAWGGIQKIFSGIWDGIKSTATTVMNLLKNIISSALTAIKSLFQTNLNLALNIVNSILTKVKDKFNTTMDNAKSVVSKGIEFIKKAFNVELKFPKIKLPHFSISGSFSLDPPSVPTFGIEWYKKAMNDPMIMNTPTAFGINNLGQIMAGGEAGSEVVSGTNTLMNMITAAVEAKNQRLESLLLRIFELLEQYIPQISNMQIVTDTGALIGELAPGMDAELGKFAVRNGRCAR